MKKIILMLVIMAGFFATAQAQSGRPAVRRTERKIERRHIRRRHRRHRRHHASQINPTATQRSQAILYKEETTSMI